MNFIIYTIENCSYCEKSKNFLESNNLKFQEILVPFEDKKHFKKINNMNTFPQIFFNSEKIGGFSDLIKIFKITNVIKSNNLSIELIRNISTEIDKNSDNDIEISF